MPRTKLFRKKSSIVSRAKQSSILGSNPTEPKDLLSSFCSNYESTEQFVKDVNEFFDNAIYQQKQAYEETKKQVKMLIWDNLNELPEAVHKSNMCSEINMSFLKPQEKEKSPIDGRTRKDVSVESFEFKRPKTPGQPLRSSSRKKSSLSTNSSHLFKTPMSKRRLTPGSVITPKLQCNTPMTMMRRPQLGEVAVSMSGSPLLVRPFAGEDVPTVNVPLQDGRVFSIMPEDGGFFLDLPFDEATKQHLRTLRAHLEILAAD